MPVVPTQDNFGALPTPVPQNAVRSSNAPDIAGQQARAIGQGMLSVGDAMAKAAQQADQVRINDAMNKAVEAKLRLTYAPDVGYTNRRGKDALPQEKPLADEYSDLLGKDIDAIESGLGNERQKQAFREQANQLLTQFRDGLMQHEAKEFTTYKLGVQEGTIKVATDQMALSWGDPEASAQSAGAIRAAVAEMGRIQGLSGQQIEANTVATLSAGHSAVIASAVDAGKLDYAREYMKQHNEELTPQARLQLTKTLEIGDFEAKTQEAADSLWAMHGGDVSAALQQAREQYSGKEEDAIVTRLKTYDAESSAIRERNQSDAADKGWQMVAQGARPGASLFAQMDGRDAIAIRKYLEEGPRQKTDVAKWLEFTNRSQQQLAAMTPQSLMRDYRNYFTDADLRNANEMILAAKGLHGKGKGNSEGLQLYTTADLTNRTARELGILPRKGKPNEEEEAAFFDFKQHMQGKVNEWEAVNGKKMPPEELANLFETEKMNRVKLDVWGRDPEKAAIAVTPDQMGKAYVEINGEEIPLSRIPPVYRVDAMQRIKARGLAPTEQLIAQMWVVDGKPKQ